MNRLNDSPADDIPLAEENNRAEESCPRCREHVEEIERLKGRVAELEARLRRQFPQWFYLGLAAVLLFLIPATPTFLWKIEEAVERAGWSRLWVGYPVLGVTLGFAWAQWSAITVFCALHWRPLWQRGFLYAGLGVIPALMLAQTDYGPFEALQLARLGPLLAWLIAIPTLLHCLTKRWVLAARSVSVEIRPVSLRFYFTAIALCAVWLTAAKFVGSKNIATNAYDVLLLVGIFVGPVVAMSLASPLLLGRMLNETRKRSVLGRTLFLASVAGTLMLTALAFVFEERRRGATVNWSETLAYSMLSLTLLASGCAYLAGWTTLLKKLGYRLVTRE